MLSALPLDRMLYSLLPPVHIPCLESTQEMHLSYVWGMEWICLPHTRSNCLTFITQLDKHMPKYLRRKLQAEMIPKSRIFEIQPTSGVLDPGERSNVQVKFMPTEEVISKEN